MVIIEITSSLSDIIAERLKNNPQQKNLTHENKGHENRVNLYKTSNHHGVSFNHLQESTAMRDNEINSVGDA